MGETDTGPTGPVIDEMLCFMVNKMDTLDCDTIIRLCVGKYDENQTKTSKNIAFDLLHKDTDATKHVKRRSPMVGESPNEKNIRDIYQLLNEKGTVLPKFVALDLSNLPPVTFDNIDVSVLLTKIERVKSKVDSFQVASESQIELSSALADSQGALTNRVASLENLVAKLSIKDSDSDIKKIELCFECTECDIKCGTKEALENHNAKVHTFGCDICDHKCDSKGNLKTHVESHKAEAHKEQGKEKKCFRVPSVNIPPMMEVLLINTEKNI